MSIEEWNDHKRRMTFQRYISERMPMFFGPLASNVPLFEKIKTAERQLDIRFSISKQNNFWTFRSCKLQVAGTVLNYTIWVIIRKRNHFVRRRKI